jgi:hypothetical protein
MSRTIERAVARREYEKFSKKWREEKRFAGVYGQVGYRKPSFNEWYHMHQRNLEMMKESTPADVQEHLGLDPWIEVQDPPRTAKEIHDEAIPEENRGVITIDIATGEEERNG